MNIHHTLIFFYFALWARNTGLINAQILVRTGNEGGNITVACDFLFSGIKKIFCQEPCEEVLIETTDVTAQRGRYSIAYEEGTFPVYGTILYVSITKLIKSDAGKYRCGLHRSISFNPSYQEIEIRVNDAPISSKPTLTLQPFSASVPSVPSASTLTTQRLNSSPGTSTPSSASPKAALIYVGLCLAVMIVVLIAAVLLFCRKRASIPKEPAVETEYANGTEANWVYEEIREEDRQHSSPPAEVSTVYTYIKHTKPDRDETTDEYSLATAATSQKTIEDASSELIYSDVDFAGSPSASLHSAPGGDADNVVYSVPRVAEHSYGTSPPLYSIVTSH